MDPIWIIILLLALAAVLLLSELALPTHGVLGVAGLLALGGALAECFYLNRWFGLTIFLAAILASPLLLNLAMKIWSHSPVGRRLILQPIQTNPPPPQIRLGQLGVAVTELRPMGECDFDDHRLEALSELGIIQAGQQVKVVAIDNGRPTVRLAHT